MKVSTTRKATHDDESGGLMISSDVIVSQQVLESFPTKTPKTAFKKSLTLIFYGSVCIELKHYCRTLRCALEKLYDKIEIEKGRSTLDLFLWKYLWWNLIFSFLFHFPYVVDFFATICTSASSRYHTFCPANSSVTFVTFLNQDKLFNFSKFYFQFFQLE